MGAFFVSPNPYLLSNLGSDELQLFQGVEILEASPRLKAIAEYERAEPILVKEVGDQSLVFKDFLLRYADLVAEEDDYLSREKAYHIRVRANKIDAVAVS